MLGLPRASQPTMGTKDVPLDNKTIYARVPYPLSEKRKRNVACGRCAPCSRDDCGKCLNCLDKPKFGGLGIRKQSCIKRKCVEGIGGSRNLNLTAARSRIAAARAQEKAARERAARGRAARGKPAREGGTLETPTRERSPMMNAATDVSAAMGVRATAARATAAQIHSTNQSESHTGKRVGAHDVTYAALIEEGVADAESTQRGDDSSQSATSAAAVGLSWRAATVHLWATGGGLDRKLHDCVGMSASEWADFWRAVEGCMQLGSQTWQPEGDVDGQLQEEVEEEVEESPRALMCTSGPR